MLCGKCEQWGTADGLHGVCKATDFPTDADEECLLEAIESEGGDDTD